MYMYVCIYIYIYVLCEEWITWVGLPVALSSYALTRHRLNVYLAQRVPN